MVELSKTRHAHDTHTLHTRYTHTQGTRMSHTQGSHIRKAHTRMSHMRGDDTVHLTPSGRQNGVAVTIN